MALLKDSERISTERELDECPICNLSELPRIAPQRRFFKNGYAILGCPRCELLWTRTDPNFEPASIYTEDYFQGGVGDGYFDYAGSEELLRDEQVRRLDTIRRYQSAGNLFEIGCATGGFLFHARRYFSVAGVDVSRFAVDVAVRKGLPVSCGSFETVAHEPGGYDVVTMFDTIEHLKDPISTLRAVHQALRPGGILCLTTGDAQSLSAKALGSRWRLLTPPQHLWFFGAGNLSKLLEALGFSCILLRHPSRRVPVSLMWYQMFRGKARPLPPWVGDIVLPINLFDCLLILARKV